MENGLENRVFNFGQKIKSSDKLVFAIEINPPIISTPQEQVYWGIECIIDSFRGDLKDIVGILVPDKEPHEIRKDGTNSGGALHITSKEYAKLLRDRLGEESNVDIVPYIRTVSADLQTQIQWSNETKKVFKNLVLVGKDSSTKQYPGPDPAEFAKLIRDSYDTLGAICIPHRGIVPGTNTNHFKPNPYLEPLKMMKKEFADFFPTQLIFESESFENMWGKYETYCSESQRNPSRILLGLTPIKRESTILFLEYELRVYIPPDIKKFLLEDNSKITQRSIDYIIEIAKKIIDKHANDHSRLGFYVSCISPRNIQGLGAYSDLFGRLKQEFGCFLIR